MTTRESDLVAGRELDALVAEKVMRWTKRLYAGRFYWFGPYDGRRHARVDYTGVNIGDDVTLAFAEDSDPERFAPSTDMAAAWLVVEHMREVGGNGFAVWFVPHHFSWQSPEHWEAGYTTESCGEGWMPQVRSLAAGDTVPLAICRAALAAVEHSP